jgi:phospholipid/cholesterol/gamma-HCH transport system substrate-binding protein
MQQNIIETLVGFIILIIAGIFFTFAYRSSGSLSHDQGYSLIARFQSVDGVVEGSDVMLGGIKIGKVAKLTLDPDTFDAVMKMMIDRDVKLPKDSQANISSSGFLGGKFVAIVPGGDEDNLQNNDRIQRTQSAINLEALIGKFMYSFGNNGSSSSAK